MFIIVITIVTILFISTFIIKKKQSFRIPKKYLLLLSSILLLTTGCNKVQISKPTKVMESLVVLVDLNTFDNKKIKYTQKRNIIGQSAINNIGYKIIELSNKNAQMYSYVLDLSQKPFEIEDKKNGLVPFEVIKISVGAKSENDSIVFSKSASSPVFMDYKNARVGEASYYLFDSKEPINETEFKIEAFFVNAESYKVNNTLVKKGEQTYHFFEDQMKKLSIVSE